MKYSNPRRYDKTTIEVDGDDGEIYHAVFTCWKIFVNHPDTKTVKEIISANDPRWFDLAQTFENVELTVSINISG